MGRGTQGQENQDGCASVHSHPRMPAQRCGSAVKAVVPVASTNFICCIRVFARSTTLRLTLEAPTEVLLDVVGRGLRLAAHFRVRVPKSGLHYRLETSFVKAAVNSCDMAKAQDGVSSHARASVLRETLTN